MFVVLEKIDIFVENIPICEIGIIRFYTDFIIMSLTNSHPS